MHRRDLDERRDHMGDLEPERLHPQVVPHWVPVDAEPHHLIEPRHQHPCPVFAEAQNLRWLGVDRLGEPLCVESIMEKRGVLPEQLVKHIVGVEIESGDTDVPLGFAAAEHICTKQHDVARFDRLLSELAKQECGAVANNDELHAVVADRPHRAANGRRAR